jgi:hypothetical protein
MEQDSRDRGRWNRTAGTGVDGTGQQGQGLMEQDSRDSSAWIGQPRQIRRDSSPEQDNFK